MATSTPPSTALPEALQPWVWQGAGDLQARARRGTCVVGSGFPALDAQLPGGGWPRGLLCELLVDEALSCEWRLLLPALRAVAARGESIFLIGPPQPPQAGLHAMLGCPPHRLVWVHADEPSQAGWACEQVLKSGMPGAVLAWLPRIGSQALRRLQAAAQAQQQARQAAGGQGPAGCLLVVVRPAAAREQSSPAPLRVVVGPGLPASASAAGADADVPAASGLLLHILKRRGPLHEVPITLAALPDGLAPALAGKLARPGGLSARRRARMQAVPPVASAPPLPVAPVVPAAAPPAVVIALPEVVHAVLAGPAPSHV